MLDYQMHQQLISSNFWSIKIFSEPIRVGVLDYYSTDIISTGTQKIKHSQTYTFSVMH